MIGGAENAGGRALTAERLAGADVAVEFTQPDAAVANLERLIEAGVPAVTGTTGWRDQLPRITARWSSAAAARCSTPPTSRSASTSSCAPRTTWPAASPGARSSTPLYWRSITRPSSTRRRARRASSRRARAPADPARDVPDHLGARGRHPGHARVAYDGPTSGSRWRTWRGAARASRPARWRRPSGCPGIAGSTRSRTCSSERVDDALRGLRHRAGHAVHRGGDVDFRALARARRVADRRRDRLPRALRLHRRGADPGRRASASRSWPTVVETAAGRVPVMAGATSNDTRRAVDETRRMCAPGRRLHPHRHALLQQAHAGRPVPPLSRPSPTPRPGRSASTTFPAAPRSICCPPTALRLAEHPNVIGIKEASGDLRQIMEILRGRPDGFAVLSGDDWLALAVIAAGRRRAHLGHLERGAGSDDGAGAPRARRRSRGAPASATTACCRSWTPTSSRPIPSPVKAGAGR